MNHFKKRNIQTTLGELITALSEEIRPFLKNEREISIVVGYIFNDLLRGSRFPEQHRRTKRRPSLFFPLVEGQTQKS
jgi:hypothetical protein